MTDPPPVPAGKIVVIDERGFLCVKGKPPYMWTWIGGPKWYHVRDFPVPMQLVVPEGSDS